MHDEKIAEVTFAGNWQEMWVAIHNQRNPGPGPAGIHRLPNTNNVRALRGDARVSQNATEAVTDMLTEGWGEHTVDQLAGMHLAEENRTAFCIHSHLCY